MRPEELAHVCEEAARDLLAREGRPLPPTVVLPDPRATRLVRIPDLPADDDARSAVLTALAREEVVAASRPAYGFVAEAETTAGADVAVVVYGAHGLAPRITAAPFVDGGTGLGPFAQAEDLDPDAMVFLRPLQEAVETVREPPQLPGFGHG